MNPQKIKILIEERFNLSLLEKTRKRETVYARVIYCKILKDQYQYTLQEIADALNSNHSTVFVAINKTMDTILKYEREYSDCYFDILEDIDKYKNGDVDKLREELSYYKKQCKDLRARLRSKMYN